MSHHHLRGNLILIYQKRHQRLGVRQSNRFNVHLHEVLKGVSSKFLQKIANCNPSCFVLKSLANRGM